MKANQTAFPEPSDWDPFKPNQNSIAQLGEYLIFLRALVQQSCEGTRILELLMITAGANKWNFGMRIAYYQDQENTRQYLKLLEDLLKKSDVQTKTISDLMLQKGVAVSDQLDMFSDHEIDFCHLVAHFQPEVALEAEYFLWKLLDKLLEAEIVDDVQEKILALLNTKIESKFMGLKTLTVIDFLVKQKVYFFVGKTIYQLLTRIELPQEIQGKFKNQKKAVLSHIKYLPVGEKKAAIEKALDHPETRLGQFFHFQTGLAGSKRDKESLQVLMAMRDQILCQMRLPLSLQTAKQIGGRYTLFSVQTELPFGSIQNENGLGGEFDRLCCLD